MKIGPVRGLHGCVGFKGDFVAHIRELSAEFPVRRKRLYNWGAATGCRQHCGNLKRLLHKIGTNSKGVLPLGHSVLQFTCADSASDNFQLESAETIELKIAVSDYVPARYAVVPKLGARGYRFKEFALGWYEARFGGPSFGSCGSGSGGDSSRGDDQRDCHSER